MSYEDVATPAQADREYARNAGRDHPELAWICSNRDCWHPNPFYQGEPQPHPEDDEAWETCHDEPQALTASEIADGERLSNFRQAEDANIDMDF
jgi:hypothetical protein